MKFFLILTLAIIASSSAEDVKPEPEAKPMDITWKAKYGEYGVEEILPLQYNVPVYRYEYPGVPYPGVQYPGVPYPLSYNIPYPARVAIKNAGNVVTSYDPEYFSSVYGFYPDH